MASTKYKKVDFLVELSSIGVTGKSVLIDQQYLIPKQSGKSEKYGNGTRHFFEGMVEIVENNDEEVAQDKLATFLGNHYDIAPEEVKEQNAKMNVIMGMSYSSIMHGDVNL